MGPARPGGLRPPRPLSPRARSRGPPLCGPHSSLKPGAVRGPPGRPLQLRWRSAAPAGRQASRLPRRAVRPKTPLPLGLLSVSLSFAPPSAAFGLTVSFSPSPPRPSRAVPLEAPGVFLVCGASRGLLRAGREAFKARRFAVERQVERCSRLAPVKNSLKNKKKGGKYGFCLKCQRAGTGIKAESRVCAIVGCRLFRLCLFQDFGGKRHLKKGTGAPPDERGGRWQGF